MKLKRLTELWILDTQGKTHFHYPQTLAKDKSGLLQNFLAGIIQFMNEMGGNEVYHVTLEASTIVGLRLDLNLEENKIPLFLVGAFTGERKRKNLKRLKTLREEFLEILNERSDCEQKRSKLIKNLQEHLHF